MMNLLAIIALAIVLIAILTVVLFPGLAYQAAMRVERRLAGLATRSVDVGGIQISYTDSGTGTPLVLLHGFTADKDHWTRVARYLTRQFRVIAPDLPGFGESTRDPALSYSIDVQAQRLRKFFDRLGLEQFHLGGSSMGGGIAVAYAARNPQRVLSLWLLAPAGVMTEQRSEMEQILLSGAACPLIPGNRQEFEDTLTFVFVKRPFVPWPLRRYLTRVAVEHQALRKKIFAELLDASGTGMRYPLDKWVEGLTIPTLIVWGESDRVLHPAGAHKLGTLLKNSVVELMPEMGHLPMLENPRSVAAGFLRFQTQFGRSPSAADD